MRNKFSEGDIVKLKSGGPNMSVREVKGSGKLIVCQWFAGSNLKQGHFNEETLEIVKEEKGD